MTKNEQIQEMAEIISTACKGIRCSDCETHGTETSACVDVKSAEALYSKGYRKVERGEWIKDEESIFEHRYRCSVCAFYRIGAPTKHCPECGADMRGGNNE